MLYSCRADGRLAPPGGGRTKFANGGPVAGVHVGMSDAGTTSNVLNLAQLLAHGGWLRRMAGGLLADGAAADDAVQEAVVTAWRRPPGDQGPRGLRGWLAVVIRNHVRGQARQERRRARAVASAAAEPAPAATPTPEEVATGVELQRLVAALVLELPEPARQVICLRYFEELDSPAIAARLGIAAGTVRWRLQAALGELRARLDRQDGEGGRRWRRGLAALAPAPAAAPGADPAPAPAAATAPAPAAATAPATATAPVPGTAVGAAKVGAAGAASGGAAGWLVGAAALAALAMVGGAALRPGASQASPGTAATAVAAAGDASGTAAAAAGERRRRLPGLFAALSGAEGALASPPAQLKTAPFSGLRWQDGDVPEVLVNGTWSRLDGIDAVAAADIVRFCKQRFPARPGQPPERLWRKRFSEDLVDVLTAMGHAPRALVTLRLLREGSPRPESVTAEMTRENRQRLWRANQEAEPGPAAQPAPAARSAAHAPAPSPMDRWARVSPFTGVAFRGEAIDVEVDGAWYGLVSMAGVTSERLVAVARQRFGEAWKKRLAEDPVEVLVAATGSGPGTAVDLTLAPPGGGAGGRIHKRGVALTEENRRRVKQTWRP
jgi:RNA polymerase sigma factor (sigma-70 family)